MRARPPAYLILLLAACAGTEVGNPTFACAGEDTASRDTSPGGSGGSGGTGGYGGNDPGACSPDGFDCGLAAFVGSFAEAACPGGASRTGLFLTNLTDGPIAGSVVVSGGAVTVVPDVFDLPPHGEEVLAVIFQPPADAAAGPRGAELTIVLDGEPPRTLELSLEAAVDPQARTSLGLLCEGDVPCEILDLGAAPVGKSAVASLAVVNDGCDALELLAPDLETDGRIALVDPPAFPAAIPSRGRLVLELSFTPAATGPTGGTQHFSTTGGVIRALPWEGLGQ